MRPASAFFEGRVGALATKHGKESVIAPALERELGLCVEIAPGVDTDAFGTFTREIPRRGSPLEAARAKAAAAIEHHGRTSIGIASEGSFGPHPSLFFLAGGFELVLLKDASSGVELRGIDITAETNFASREIRSLEDAFAFADRADFPSHGLIVMAARDGQPDPESRPIEKGIVERARFVAAVERLLASDGRAWVETDMRAHLNPTRMRSIARACAALAAAASSACPACARPGYVVVSARPGLPCEDCDGPTPGILAKQWACSACGYEKEAPVEGRAPVASCPQCNP